MPPHARLLALPAQFRRHAARASLWRSRHEGAHRKGWCPGALRPMESGDGLIVRLKITAAR